MTEGGFFAEPRGGGGGGGAGCCKKRREGCELALDLKIEREGGGRDQMGETSDS